MSERERFWTWTLVIVGFIGVFTVLAHSNRKVVKARFEDQAKEWNYFADRCEKTCQKDVRVLNFGTLECTCK